MGSFIVAGSDGVAVRVAENLLAVGEQVVVIAREMEPRLRNRLEDEGVRVLDGDARDVSDLRSAGLTAAAGIAIVEQDDVGNLHAALAARGARADMRLVVRMFNEQLASRIEALVPQALTLSASALAAPAFLRAALQTSQHVVLADRAFEVRRLSPDDDPATAVPLAIFDPQTGASKLFPAAAGGVMALVPDDQDEDDGSAIEAAAGDLRQAASLVASMLTRGVALARLLDRRLLVLLAFLVLIVTAAALTWKASTQYDLLDSAYFVVTTVSTVGYGDITPLHHSPALKVGVMGLMLVGALSLALIYALITDALVGARLARSLGERPRPRRDHIVVLGLGRVGQRVIEALVARGVPCIAVERDESAPGVHAARRLRVPVQLSDAAAPAALDGLFLERARCLMVLTDDDGANLAAALNARALRSDLRIVLRLFDHDLAERVETAFSIDASRSVSSLVAPAFAAALSDRRVLATIPVGAQAVAVVELPAPADRTVAQLEQAAQSEARVIALDRSWNPSPEDRVRTGQPIVAVGSPAGLARLMQA
jgi:Trk K+ transport system NAD-binding subunit